MLQRLNFSGLELLVDRILDSLPDSVWNDPAVRFLDPDVGCGRGIFARAVEGRLRKYGHSDENISARVYGYTSEPIIKNFLVTRYSLVGNYEVKNFLEEEINMDFDVILGNPPYQHPTNKRWKLWVQFITKSLDHLEEGGIFGFITPIIWYKNPVGTEIETAFDTIVSKKVLSVEIDCNEYFNVGEDVGYFILENSTSDESHKTKVLNRGEFFCEEKIQKKRTDPISEILEMVENKLTEYGSVINHSLTFNTHKKDLKSEKYHGSVPVHHSVSDFGYVDDTLKCRKKTGDKKYVYAKDVLDEYSLFVNLSGYYFQEENPSKYMKVDKGYVAGRATAQILFSSKGEAENALTLLSSKLYQFFVNNKKTGGFNTTAMKSLPMLPTNKKWNDHELYEFFGLTLEQIKLVEGGK